MVGHHPTTYTEQSRANPTPSITGSGNPIPHGSADSMPRHSLHRSQLGSFGPGGRRKFSGSRSRYAIPCWIWRTSSGLIPYRSDSSRRVSVDTLIVMASESDTRRLGVGLRFSICSAVKSAASGLLIDLAWPQFLHSQRLYHPVLVGRLWVVLHVPPHFGHSRLTAPPPPA